MAFTDKQFKKIRYVNDTIFAYGSYDYVGDQDILGDGNLIRLYATPILYKPLDGSWIDGGLTQIQVNSIDPYNPVKFDKANLIAASTIPDSYRLVGDVIDNKINVYDLSLSPSVTTGSTLLSIKTTYGSISNVYASNSSFIIDRYDRNDSLGTGESIVIESNLTNIGNRIQAIDTLDGGVKFVSNGSEKLYEIKNTQNAYIRCRSGADYSSVTSQASLFDAWGDVDPSSFIYDIVVLEDGKVLVVNGATRQYVIYNEDLTVYQSASYIIPDSPSDSFTRFALVKNTMTAEIFLFWYATGDSSWTVYKFDSITLEWSIHAQSTPLPSTAFNISSSGYVNGYYYITRASVATYYSTDMSNWNTIIDSSYLPEFDAGNLSYFDGYFYRIGRNTSFEYKLLRSLDMASWELSPINDAYDGIRKCYAVSNNLYIVSTDIDGNSTFFKYNSSDMDNPVRIVPETFYYSVLIVRFDENFLLSRNLYLSEYYYINSSLSIESYEVPAFLGKERPIKMTNILVDYGNANSASFHVCNANYQFSSKISMPNPVQQIATSYGFSAPNILEQDIIYDGNKYVFVGLYDKSPSEKYIFAATSTELTETTEWVWICDQELIGANGTSMYDFSFNGKSYMIAMEDGTFFASKDCADWYHTDLISDSLDNSTWRARVLKEQFPGLQYSNYYNRQPMNFYFTQENYPPHFFGDSIVLNSSVVINNPRSYTYSPTPISYDRILNGYEYMSNRYAFISILDSVAIAQYYSKQEKLVKLLYTDGSQFYNIANTTFNFIPGAVRAGYNKVAKNGNSVVVLMQQLDSMGNVIDFKHLYLEKVDSAIVCRWVISNDSRLFNPDIIFTKSSIIFTESSIIFDLDQIYVIDKLTGVIDDSNTGNIAYTPSIVSSTITCETLEPSPTAIEYPYSYSYNAGTFEYVGTDISSSLVLNVDDYLEKYYYDVNINAYIVAVYTVDGSYLIYKSSDLITFEPMNELNALFDIPASKIFYGYTCDYTDIVTGECAIKSGEYEKGTFSLSEKFFNFDLHKMDGYSIIELGLTADYSLDGNIETDDTVKFYYTTNWVTFTELNFAKNYDPTKATISTYYYTNTGEVTTGINVIGIDGNTNSNTFVIGISIREDVGGQSDVGT